MQLPNKVIEVTGSDSGIGRELSLQLLQKGAQVAGVEIHLDMLLAPLWPVYLI